MISEVCFFLNFHERCHREVKGQTCTGLYWGLEGWEHRRGCSQAGNHRAESRHRTISSSVRYSLPPSDRAMMLALYPANPVESTSWEEPNTRTQTAAENTLGLRQLYLTIRKVTWTHQSIGSLPFCSCHRGPSATHPAPAHQYSHYRPGEGWHKRSHEIKRYSVLGGYQIQGSTALPTVLCLRMLALDRMNDDYDENTNTRSHLVIVGEEGVELFHCESYTLRTEE